MNTVHVVNGMVMLSSLELNSEGVFENSCRQPLTLFDTTNIIFSSIELYFDRTCCFSNTRIQLHLSWVPFLSVELNFSHVDHGYFLVFKLFKMLIYSSMKWKRTSLLRISSNNESFKTFVYNSIEHLSSSE